MKKNYSYLFFILTFFCVNGYALGKIQEEKLNCNTLVTDKQNIIWFGTSNGLYQWRNQHVQRIALATNLNITAICSINQHLIIGTKKGAVYVYSPEQKKLDLVAYLKSEISCIEFNHNLLCIASKGNGFVTINPYEIRKHTTSNGLKDDFIYKVSLEQNGSVWTSSDMGLQITFPDHRTESFVLNKLIPDRLVTSFEKKGSLLICGTQRGDLCKINLENDSVQIFDASPWKSAQVFDIKILDHSIAIATEGGAYLLDLNGRLIETIQADKSLLKVGLDQEANLWFCGNKSIISSPGEQLQLNQSFDQISTAFTHALFADSTMNIYFTPDQGLVQYNVSTKTSRQIAFPLTNSQIDITSIYLDHYGKLWVGTSGKGIYMTDTTTFRFREIPIDSSLETSGILSITGDNETIWVSSLNGVWFSPVNTSSYSFKSLEDLYQKKKYYVYQVKKDRKNNLWLATDGQGILKLSNGVLSDFAGSFKMNAKTFYSVEEDDTGNIWLNASGDGLYCVGQDSVFHLNQSNGLSSNDILAMHSYGHDYLVAVSAGGIDLVNIHTKAVCKYDLEQMHKSLIPEINSITEDHRTNLYIGTNLGVVSLYVPSYKTHFVPNARIEDISVMEKSELRSRKNYSYEENYFRIFISADYNSNETIYFRYKLKGLNDIWSNTIEKVATYPRLNPGRYEFILETSNNRNFLNASRDSYSFVISNPFWKQSWFVLSMLTVFGVCFYYYVRFREKRISRVEQLQKEKVIAEFETLKHQVSPHFLFNSFNTLIQIIDEDKEQAIEYTQMLSDYYRSLISYRLVDLVSLNEELMLLEKYIYLQKMRFGESLMLDNRCKSKPVCDIEVPPLTLQLLAENAIKHNTVSSTKPLTITIELTDDSIVISNNLNEKVSKEAGENIGLQNIKNRFKLFTKKDVEIHKTHTKFVVVLPILKP